MLSSFSLLWFVVGALFAYFALPKALAFAAGLTGKGE